MSDALDAETVATIRERYATDPISQPGLAAEYDISESQVVRAIETAGWDDAAADAVTVAADATVLKYATGTDRFHLPTPDGMPLCGEQRDRFWPKDRAVLAWYECCEKCARHVVIRGAGLTTAEVSVDE